ETAPAAPEAPRQALPPPLVQPRFNADYLDNPKPPYPSISRRMGEEGEVRLRVQVDAAGNAQQVEIERSSGYPRLDQAALDTVKRWRFVPARQGEQAVAAAVIVPIQFTLRN
ncbi:MAG: energy transducer TonB, partial [Pseudomonadota bacterium]